MAYVRNMDLRCAYESGLGALRFGGQQLVGYLSMSQSVII